MSQVEATPNVERWTFCTQN